MKKLLFCALAGAIGFAGAKTYEHSQKNITNDLLLQNVEALTSGEDSYDGQPLKCFKSVTTQENSTVLYCGGCVWVDGTNTLFSGTDKCNPQ